MHYTRLYAFVLCSCSCIGPPAAPRVSFNFLNATAISFSWEKPFSVASVTDILYYTVRMYSRGSVSQDRKEWTVPQTSDTSYAHVVTSDAVATSCDQLVFEVSATSVAGTSPTQSVSGGFPIGMYNASFFLFPLVPF